MNPRLPFLREKTAKLTTSPGVYLMKNEKKTSVICFTNNKGGSGKGEKSEKSSDQLFSGFRRPYTQSCQYGGIGL